jgi:hypothetical protein
MENCKIESALIEIRVIRDKNTPSSQDDCPPTAGVGKKNKNNPPTAGVGAKYKHNPQDKPGG